ncbi:MAG: HD domain-containing protein [Proteobacteria bacterium]|nr:HD domain-containing protein [Pseudomonadota bacterium]
MVAAPCTYPVRVVVIDPEGRERVAQLKVGDTGPLLLGRAPENDLQVVSPYISRRHAEIWPHESGILFEDLSSTSGSYVDGARVDKSLVRVGDSLRLGSPDGLRLSVYAVEDTKEKAKSLSRTEVLRVADLEESPYLSSTDRLLQSLPARRKTSETKSQERLVGLISLVSDLLTVSDADDMADKLLTRVMQLLPVDRGMVLLEEKDGLKPRAWNVRGESEVVRTQIGPELGDLDVPMTTLERPAVPFQPIRTVTDRVYSEGVGLLSLDATSDQRLEGSKSVLLQSVRSITAAPVVGAAKRIYGVIYVDTHRTMRKDDEDTLDWLVAVAHQAGMVMDKLALLDSQRRMIESMMKGLAASIDKRDGLTAGHSARVADYSVGMARQMGQSTEQQYAIYYAALLHDYGKIGIDDAVLKKPASLTPDEYKHIQQHPKFTFDILSKIEFPPELAELPMMAASHHEKWDGSGYPWGLAGDDIPVAGRIMAIADVYDSLTQKRHYRDPMPTEEVLGYLEEGRGTHFDPAVLDAFFAYHAEVLGAREERRARKRARPAVTAGPHDTTQRKPLEHDDEVRTDDMDAVEHGQNLALEPLEEEGTLRLEPGS